MKNKRILTWALASACCLGAVNTYAQNVRYIGSTLSNPYRHDGGLSPVVGVHNIQLMRANREHPDKTNCQGWTYNHQPMMAYWQGRFWVHYLSDPRSEHIPPSVTWLQTSANGYDWDNPIVLFPEYQLPTNYKKADCDSIAPNGMKAVMHQRVGWYVSSEKTGQKLLAIGNYGICLYPKDDPNDGNGIGRVVREIHPDGSMGDIYFIYYNHDFNAKNTLFPHFTKSKDKKFRAACQEILDNPYYWMQMVEECDRNDPHLPLKNMYKAFNYYTLPDGKTDICFWKHALTSVSTDGGHTWRTPVGRAPGFVNSNAKIWGQRLSDGSYATVYNPSEFRWPLAISLSTDGVEYTTLNLVNGEIPPMRYGGNYKSYGPQYVRGIQPGNGIPADGNLWVSYSMSKEDIWISKIPVPVRTQATAHANDEFEGEGFEALKNWNIYSPVYAPVRAENGQLVLRDEDPYDYAKAERVIPSTRELRVAFDITPSQNDHGTLHIEFLDAHGNPCSRIEWMSDGSGVRVKVGARQKSFLRSYDANKTYHIVADVSLSKRTITISVDGKKSNANMLFAPVESIERICFRTGDMRLFPTPETPADNDLDVPNAGDKDAMAQWNIQHFKTEALPVTEGGIDAVNPFIKAGMSNQPCALLQFKDYKHYVDEFNGMEDENIVQAIPNSQSVAWMEANIPLLDCPDKQLEQMYYYRWWSLRKHIKETPVGYGMTEFLVERKYADKYNLIACAIGHHVMESRWLRDTTYVSQLVHTWFRGNDGHAMEKLDKFSSWVPAALEQYTAVTGQWDWLVDMRPDLEADFARWDSLRLLPGGLYWQEDVKDGMEESISGGRKIQNMRPTINSYMWANAMALSHILNHEADASTQDSERQTLCQKAQYYGDRAQKLRELIEEKLWNADQRFFETRTVADTMAQVREAIGFIPWYFNLPSAEKDATHREAWLQLTDKKGFDAPFGLTTAEMRHPRFRKRGVGTCEWDGAIWPFATSQTLTALGNYLNNYNQGFLSDSLYFAQLKKYTESQSRRGRPYIGEYLDETNGQWLMGDRERSRYYNHSTYCDLVINGLIGIRPSTDKQLVVNPLVPQGQWNYFCLDGVLYHGHLLTVVWDADGQHYRQGQGLQIWVDGKPVAQSAELGALTITL